MTLTALIDQWRRWDKNPKTLEQLEALVKANNTPELERRLGTRMEFGTAGLRASMGVGNAHMNEVTVIQAAQGLAAYLTQQFSAEERTSRGIVIGYDARYNSQTFARLSANVFLNAGLKTILFRQIVPTPFVPFAVLKYRCLAGVMVTASHNPKEDNGYKVYWDNGAQIVPPLDSGISKCIAKNLEPLETSWKRTEGAIDAFDEVYACYFQTMKSELHHASLLSTSPLKITYTAMHGVGTQFASEAIVNTAGLPNTSLILVKEQVAPDPEFPTVPFPNPEEGKSALHLAMATADACGSRLILANDPDADRLAVAERLPSGTWRVFTGNQIGALIGWWTVHEYRQQHGALAKGCYFISSAVSSMILKSIAETEGIAFRETLTGFKWMGTLAAELQRTKGTQVLLAFEEAIGFMCGTRVYDKDGVTAAAVMTEMVAFLDAREDGKTLSQQLEDIWKTYGYHFTYNSYVTSKDSNKAQKMFSTLSILEKGGYIQAVDGVKVLHIRDLMVGLDTRLPGRKADLPCSTISPMITFYFENQVSLTIRGSGTEPKVKWYSELITKDAMGEQSLKEFVDKALAILLRQNEFGFSTRTA